MTEADYQAIARYIHATPLQMVLVPKMGYEERQQLTRAFLEQMVQPEPIERKVVQ